MVIITSYLPIPNDIKINYINEVSVKRVLTYVTTSSVDVKIRYAHLLEFIKAMSNEHEKYISPVVFINIARQYHCNNHGKYKFNDDDLFKLRIWCNQLREEMLLAEYNNNETNNTSELIINDKLIYLSHSIYSEIVNCAKPYNNKGEIIIRTLN